MKNSIASVRGGLHTFSALLRLTFDSVASPANVQGMGLPRSFRICSQAANDCVRRCHEARDGGFDPLIFAPQTTTGTPVPGCVDAPTK